MYSKSVMDVLHTTYYVVRTYYVSLAEVSTHQNRIIYRVYYFK